MPNYHNILVAVDLTHEAPQVLAHAKSQAQEHSAKLSVVTVLRPINFAYAGMDIGWATAEIPMFEEEAKRHAEARLKQLTQEAGITSVKTYVCIGAPAQEIKKQAEELCADLIVLGTHSRQGLSLLLGSTANGVLHGASCDVLAVKIASDIAVAA